MHNICEKIPDDSLEYYLENGWILDKEDREPNFGKLAPGDTIGIINLLERKGNRIIAVLYKKLEGEEKIEASSNLVKRVYYIYTSSGFVRWGTPNREKLKRD